MLKRRLVIISLSVSLLAAGSQVLAADAPVASRDSVGANWSNYSWGLYYKNLGLRTRSGPGRQELLKKAMARFSEAVGQGVALDRVYLQLSDCAYYINDFPAAIEYARLSMKADPSDMRPYHRIYTVKLKMRRYDEAAAVLEEYMAVKPDEVQVRFTLAEHYLRKMNDPAKSADSYRKVIALAARLPVEDYYREQSYLSLGAITYRSGDAAGAADMYREALGVNRESMEALFYLALLSMELYDLDGAEKYARLYLDRRPDEKAVNGVLGRVYYLRGDLAAMTYLGKAKNTGSIGGLLALGLYDELTRNDEVAEKILVSVMKYAPRTISAHAALARINERKGNTDAAFNEYVTAGVLLYNGRVYEEARRCFSAALRLNGAVPGVHYYLGKIHEDTGRTSLAIYSYSRAHDLKADTDLLLHIGYLYGVRKDYVSALRCFNSVSEREPGNSRPHFFKGLMFIWQEDYPAAERHMQRAITLDDRSETYYFYNAVIMEKLSRLERAIASLEKAIMSDPKSARAYNYLGYLYADHNMKIDESLALILKALELEPGNGAFIDSLGWVYFRKGEYRVALEKLLSAEEILGRENAPDPVVYDHIGDTYLRLGNIEDALKYWKKSNTLKKNEEIESKIRKYCSGK